MVQAMRLMGAIYGLEDFKSCLQLLLDACGKWPCLWCYRCRCRRRHAPGALQHPLHRLAPLQAKLSRYARLAAEKGSTIATGAGKPIDKPGLGVLVPGRHEYG